MNGTTQRKKLVPSLFLVKQSDTAGKVATYFQEMELKRQQRKGLGNKKRPRTEMPPSICFSRKLGVGALEVANILADKLSYRVLDKEILTYIALDAKIREKTVEIFDELYPGKTIEAMSFFAGEKSFVRGDYAKHLFKVVWMLALMEPAIFVGRGTYLILPRDRILAVRFISGKQHRISRLTQIFNISEQEAENKFDQINKEQQSFYNKVFNKKKISSHEFDLVINFDYIIDPNWAAEIVATAFYAKFKDEISK